MPKSLLLATVSFALCASLQAVQVKVDFGAECFKKQGPEADYLFQATDLSSAAAAEKAFKDAEAKWAKALCRNKNEELSESVSVRCVGTGVGGHGPNLPSYETYSAQLQYMQCREITFCEITEEELEAYYRAYFEAKYKDSPEARYPERCYLTK